MTVLVTRCPQCATSFRLKPAHLNSAKGAVRCGSCLHIFIAREHLITRAPRKAISEDPQANAEEDSKTEIGASTNKPSLSEPSPQVEINDETYSEPETHTEASAPIEAEAGLETKNEENSKLDSDLQVETSQPITEEDMDDELVWTQSDFESVFTQEDEPSTNDLTEDSPNTENTYPLNFGVVEPDTPEDEALIEKDIAAFTFSKDFLDSTNDSNPTHSSDDKNSFEEDYGDNIEHPESREKDEDEEDEDDDDDSWAANLLEELGDEEHLNAKEVTQHPPEEQATDLGASLFREPPTEVFPPEFAPPLNEESSVESFSESESAWLDQIEPESLEIENPMPAKPLSKNHLWASLSLLAALGLILQFANFKFDTYSRIEPWRSGYQWVCQLGLCTLPDLGDKSKISAYNLVVRSHPTTADALMVDTIILNSAAFPQAFPKLELVFSDSSNKIIASRQFKPSEYLAGELAGQNVMPRQRPIHITLELVDPGPDAMGYSIHIR